MYIDTFEEKNMLDKSSSKRKQKRSFFFFSELFTLLVLLFLRSQMPLISIMPILLYLPLTIACMTLFIHLLPDHPLYFSRVTQLKTLIGHLPPSHNVYTILTFSSQYSFHLPIILTFCMWSSHTTLHPFLRKSIYVVNLSSLDTFE